MLTTFFRRASLYLVLGVFGIVALAIAMACGAGKSQSTTTTAPDTSSTPQFAGVLMWKGDNSGSGNYAAETKLTPQNLSATTFGKVAAFPGDGNILAQPLYVSALDLGSSGKHNIVIFATEHNSVYAYDADSTSTTPLWERHYNVDGATSAPDNYGGRTTIGGEIGITGTPVIDPATGTMYFVTMLSRGGKIEQWLRAIDVRTGNDVGKGSVQITASVTGDGRGSVNGQIPFDASIQNQRAGLTLYKGQVVITWASFSDWGVYHGWVMSYDASTLAQTAVFNTTPQAQAVDSAMGPADYGGGGAIWQGGAPPSIDASGNLYLVSSDGSFNVDQGGMNHGDSVLRLTLDSSGFQIADYFTPSNQACLNVADLEIGSGGVAIIPGSLGLTVDKSGSMYLLKLGDLGKYNTSGNNIAQTLQVGSQQCRDGMGDGFAEGAGWQRLYGNPSYWNGNVYVGASSAPVQQFTVAGTSLQHKTQTAAVTGMRGANTVVSSNGTSNGILWAMWKNASTGNSEIHAFDASDISHELWNTGMNPSRDQVGPGFSFNVPVVVDGHLVASTGTGVAVYKLLQ